MEIGSAADVTRWFLALFFPTVAAFYAVRILVVAARLRKSPVYLGPVGSLHWAAQLTFRVFRVLILVVCVARLFWPPLDAVLVPFYGLWKPPILMIGTYLLAVAFVAVLIVHFSMKESWRSGTRDDDTTRLVTSGAFTISRNPMMLCVITGQIGLFLALPSGFTLICLLVGLWAVVTQVGVEEGILRQRFGAEYDAYAARTPKWLLFKNPMLSPEPKRRAAPTKRERRKVSQPSR